jgi:hypothetical protein
MLYSIECEEVGFFLFFYFLKKERGGVAAGQLCSKTLLMLDSCFTHAA